MNIQRTNSVNFGAKFICPATIKVKSPKGRWQNAAASFIAFEPEKRQDMCILEGVSRLWGGRNTSARTVEEAEYLGGRAHVFALTSQTDNFAELNPHKILGLMTTDGIEKSEEVELFRLGVNPQFAYKQNLKKRDIKHIGIAMIESLRKHIKSESNGAELFVRYADPDVMKFLNRVGIEPREKDFTTFICG